jgi:hypothetical protein
MRGFDEIACEAGLGLLINQVDWIDHDATDSILIPVGYYWHFARYSPHVRPIQFVTT